MASEGMQRLNTASTFEDEEDQEMITINYNTGAQFEGKIVNYKRVGRGTFLWPNGSQYEGDYSDNLRHGKGTQVWSDGSTYTGDFLNDLRHGQGCMCWSNGETYEGTFFKDRRHGKGTYEWTDGSSYTGTFYMDRKEGYGTFCFSTGDMFQGLYMENEREGPGVVTYKDGKQDVGLWRGEKLVKLCTKIKEAFTVKSHPEFDFKSEEHILYTDLKDENLALAPIESIFNPPEVLDYPPKVDLTERMGELYSEALHPHSLAVDKQTFDKEFFKDMPNDAMSPDRVVAWNFTPVMVFLQKHVIKHMFRQSEIDIDVDAVIRLDRSKFRECGPLEQQSEELIMAAEMGDVDKVEMLLNSGKVHPDVSDCHGHTALIGSTVNWHINIINILLNHGADVNKVTDEGCSPLAAAAVFYYPIEGFIYNIAERYLKPTSSLLADDTQQDSQIRGMPANNKERRISQLNQIKRKISESNHIHRNKSDSGVSVNSSYLKYESVLETKLQSERQAATVPSNDPDSFALEGVLTSNDYLNDIDADSAYGDDTEDRGEESEEAEDDPEEFESSQSVRNYRIEVTDKLIEKCARQLSQNELVVRREGSGKSEMDKTRLLAKLMSRRERMCETLKLLLRRGANPNTSSVPLPILFLAIKSADVDMVKLLLMKGANANARLNKEKGSLCPLHIACALPGEEGVKVTELLLNALADPNARAEEDDSFLSHILEEEWSKDSVSVTSQTLLGGRTALQIACARDDNYKNASSVVRLLLEHKADTSLMCNGFSPLALAIASGNDLAVDELLMLGADPSLPLTHGVGSAICVAVSSQYEHRRTLQGRLQLIDKLVKAGADVLAPIPIGPKRIMGTALDYAYYLFNQDHRIARIPYHALTHAEREIYSARRKLLAHVGDIVRKKAVEREKNRNLEEEEDGMRSQSPSAHFVYIGARVKLPPGFKSKFPSKESQGQVKFESSDKKNIKATFGASAAPRKPLLKYCYECGRSVGVRLTACTRCKEVFYCSKACKLKAWNARHKDECIRIGGRSRSPSPKNRRENVNLANLSNRGKDIKGSQRINVPGKNLVISADREKNPTSHKFRTGSPPNYEYVYIDNYSHN